MTARTMSRSIMAWMLLASACLFGGPAREGLRDEHFLPLDQSLIPLNSVEGRRLLWDSKAQESFWALIQFYSPQPDLGSCSVGSCTMVLNALPVTRPVSPRHAPFRLFTPDVFFNKEVEAVVTRKAVSSSGMSLEQLAKVLGTFPVDVQRVYASESDVATFRKAVQETLSRPNTFAVVNYRRKSVGQEAGGHISPLGAYNAEADRVLVIDTANYKYPWAWVKIDDLWRAMAEVADPDSHRSRGYVVVSVPAAR